MMVHQIDAVSNALEKQRKEIKELKERNRILAMKLAQVLPVQMSAGGVAIEREEK